MIDLWTKRENIVSWTNMHSVNKSILLNKQQVLEVFHDAIDGKIKAAVTPLGDFCENEGCLTDNFKSELATEILPIGTELVSTIFTSEHTGCFLLTGEYILVCSWDTDDLIII